MNRQRKQKPENIKNKKKVPVEETLDSERSNIKQFRFERIAEKESRYVKRGIPSKR